MSSSDLEVMEKLAQKPNRQVRVKFACEICGSKDHVKMIQVHYSDDYTPFNRGKKKLCADCRKRVVKKRKK
jgi:hypothetical protein